MNTVIHHFHWRSFFPSLNPSLFNYVVYKYGPRMSAQLTSGLQCQGPSDSSRSLAIRVMAVSMGVFFSFCFQRGKKKKLQKLAKTNQALNDHNVPNIKMWAYWLFNQINVNAVLYNSIEALLLMENKGQSMHEVFSHIPS